MDAVGYDAMTPGNHDWSYSADRLRELDRESSFTILASNVADTNGNRYFDNNFYIKNVTADDGTKVRVGVFGVIDEDFTHQHRQRMLKMFALKIQPKQRQRTRIFSEMTRIVILYLR